MAVVRVPVVIPDNIPSLVMILAVGGCGFAAQVRRVIANSMHGLLMIYGWCRQMTMTSGLQRETAGRGTIAIYVQVSGIVLPL